jgi:hypothetical protein
LRYYTIELTRSAHGWRRLQELAAHARQASEQMRLEGVRVRFLRFVYVPEEEACFYLFRATSEEAVREAARRADLAFDRVSEATSEGGE